jgi:hypothetical protein
MLCAHRLASSVGIVPAKRPLSRPFVNASSLRMARGWSPTQTWMSLRLGHQPQRQGLLPGLQRPGPLADQAGWRDVGRRRRPGARLPGSKGVGISGGQRGHDLLDEVLGMHRRPGIGKERDRHVLVRIERQHRRDPRHPAAVPEPGGAHVVRGKAETEPVVRWRHRSMHLVDRRWRQDGALFGQPLLEVEHPESHQVPGARVHGRCPRVVEGVERNRALPEVVPLGRELGHPGTDVDRGPSHP